MEIGPLVPEKKIIRLFTIYGRDSHLGHMTNIMLTHFYFLVPKSLQTQFGKKKVKWLLKKVLYILICK